MKHHTKNKDIPKGYPVVALAGNPNVGKVHCLIISLMEKSSIPGTGRV